MRLAPPLAAVLIGAVVAPALLGAAGAAPPPESLCAVCGDRLEGATDRGTLDVHLEDDGNSRWIERVSVDGSAAARYREDPARLERAVDGAFRRYHVTRGDVADRSVALEGETVVVTYAVADLARPGVRDGWIVDYFAAGESKTRYAVVADRVRIHPPEGYALTTRPPGATIEDGAATWYGADGDDFDEQTYLTYGPGDGAVASAIGWANVGLETGPVRLRHAALGGLLPAVVLGVAAVVVGRVDGSTPAVGRLHRRLRALETDRLGRIVVALGAAGAVGALALGEIQVGSPLAPGAVAIAVAALCYAVLGGLAVAAGDRLGERGLFVAAVAGALGTAGATALVVGRPIPPTPSAFALSAAAFLPLGFALERAGPRWPALALATAPPFVLVAVVAPVGAFAWGPFLVSVVLVPSALVAAAAGYPLSILGRRTAARDG